MPLTGRAVRTKSEPSPETTPRRPAGVSFATPLALEGVTHAYGQATTLRGVDVRAEASEVLCLLGPSGSGKTTLLRVAAGLERRHGGRVLLGDTVLAGGGRFVEPERRGIALVFQDFALFPHMNVRENVAFGLSSLKRKDRDRAAMAALESVRLADHAQRLPHQLSGGQQQRVALARAMAPRPSVILMDEPFSGLDLALREAVRADTLRVLREARTTALIVTHDADEAMRMGDSIALLRDGRLAQHGNSREVYSNPVDLAAARFFGDVNVFEAHIGDGRAETAIGQFDAAGLARGRGSVALRPSAFELAGEGGIDARVLARRYLGRDELFTLALEGRAEPLRAALAEGTVPPDATRLRLAVRKRDALVFESSVGNA